MNTEFKKARKAAGDTLDFAGLKTGVSPSQLSRFERGYCKIDDMKKIARMKKYMADAAKRARAMSDSLA